jgi:hypothetical protein
LRTSQRSVITSFAMRPDTTMRAFRISGWRRVMFSTCEGCTNMALTLVVWSARPIQPRIRLLVRPHFDGGVSTSKADMSPVANRISG